MITKSLRITGRYIFVSLNLIVNSALKAVLLYYFERHNGAGAVGKGWTCLGMCSPLSECLDFEHRLIAGTELALSI